MRILFATHNQHKLREIQEILSNFPGSIICAKDLGMTEEVEENGTSFLENAEIKARALYNFAKAQGLLEEDDLVMADDSGLCVPALGGAPGVRSARFALDAITDPAEREALQAGGRARLDAENIRHLLARCQEVSAPVRAYFYSVGVWVASADDPRPLIAGGLWWGTLLAQPRGEGGFGYDPIFQPDGHACSAAELSADEKNAISHRHRALVRLNTLLDEAGV